ncbi:MAG: sialidase family protein [Planctomycetia bacterium]|nr:sialidase family protein [Planctomycetia bacterium]
MQKVHVVFWGRLLTSVVLVVLAAVCALDSRCCAQEETPTIDISQDLNRHVIIAAGTPEIYQGHPYLVQNPDDSLLLVWCINHGGPAGPIAYSSDRGLTWTRIDANAPEEYRTHTNCPSIYRLVDVQGHAWHWVFTSQPWLARIVSGDGGKTWEEKAPLGFANVMAFSSIVPKNPNLQDGCYIGFFHRLLRNDGVVLNKEPRTNGRLEVVVSETEDAGFTWSEPRVIASVEGKDLCEPCAIWSPDNKELCCLMRENTHKGRSMATFSSDAGQTWTQPQDVSWELTGDRHIARYIGENRLFIAFRDQALESPTRGHFLGWVGSYDDIKNATPGEYRVKLLHSYAKPWVGDCGYSGVGVFDDGSVIALTYIKYRDDEDKHSIVETRFTVEELDAMASEYAKANESK